MDSISIFSYAEYVETVTLYKQLYQFKQYFPLGF
jgi:hypothetical protein